MVPEEDLVSRKLESGKGVHPHRLSELCGESLDKWEAPDGAPGRSFTVRSGYHECSLVGPREYRGHFCREQTISGSSSAGARRRRRWGGRGAGWFPVNHIRFLSLCRPSSIGSALLGACTSPHRRLNGCNVDRGQ